MHVRPSVARSAACYRPCPGEVARRLLRGTHGWPPNSPSRIGLLVETDQPAKSSRRELGDHRVVQAPGDSCRVPSALPRFCRGVPDGYTSSSVGSVHRLVDHGLPAGGQRFEACGKSVGDGGCAALIGGPVGCSGALWPYPHRGLLPGHQQDLAQGLAFTADHDSGRVRGSSGVELSPKGYGCVLCHRGVVCSVSHPAAGAGL